jgi:hypothetical protein
LRGRPKGRESAAFALPASIYATRVISDPRRADAAFRTDATISLNQKYSRPGEQLQGRLILATCLNLS